MAKDMTKLVIKIEDEAGWHSIIESSDDKLVIIDIHQDWCGPTDAIHSTLSRVFAVCIKSSSLGSNLHIESHMTQNCKFDSRITTMSIAAYPLHP